MVPRMLPSRNQIRAPDRPPQPPPTPRPPPPAPERRCGAQRLPARGMRRRARRRRRRRPRRTPRRTKAGGGGNRAAHPGGGAASAVVRTPLPHRRRGSGDAGHPAVCGAVPPPAATAAPFPAGTPAPPPSAPPAPPSPPPSVRGDAYRAPGGAARRTDAPARAQALLSATRRCGVSRAAARPGARPGAPPAPHRPARRIRDVRPSSAGWSCARSPARGRRT